MPFEILKKLKETQATITYKNLIDYLQETIGIESLLVNNKAQTPELNVSRNVLDEWVSWKINP